MVAIALHRDDAVAVARDDDPAVGRAEAAEASCLRRRDPQTLPSRRPRVNLPFGRRARYAHACRDGRTRDTGAAAVDPGRARRPARATRPATPSCSAGERAGYRQFADATIEMARRLHGAGVRKGDRVGLLMNASLDAFALQVGAMRLGAIPVPINARFKARRAALRDPPLRHADPDRRAALRGACSRRRARPRRAGS